MRSLFLWGQTQILILEILNVCLRLKFSSSPPARRAYASERSGAGGLILTKNPSFRSGTIYIGPGLIVYMHAVRNRKGEKNHENGYF